MKATRTIELKVSIRLQPGISLDFATQKVRQYLAIMGNETAANTGKRVCFPDDVQVRLIGHSTSYDQG
jgi:hypothetical protein